MEKVGEVAWATRRALEATRSAYMLVSAAEIDRLWEGCFSTRRAAAETRAACIRAVLLSRVPATVRVDEPPPGKGLVSVRIPAAVRLAEAALREAEIYRFGASIDDVFLHMRKCAEVAWPFALNDFNDADRCLVDEQIEWVSTGKVPSAETGDEA